MKQTPWKFRSKIWNTANSWSHRKYCNIFDKTLKVSGWNGLYIFKDNTCYLERENGNIRTFGEQLSSVNSCKWYQTNNIDNQNNIILCIVCLIAQLFRRWNPGLPINSEANPNSRVDIRNLAVITTNLHAVTVISQSTSVLDTIYANTKHLPCHYPRSFKPVNAARLL